MDPADRYPHAAAFIAQETDALLKILQRDDDLVPETLRFHLVVESHLERIIVALLPRGQRLIKNGRLTFAHKLRIVESLTSVEAPVFASLSHLNRLRNKCAHDRNRVVTAEDLTRIGGPMGAEFAEIRRLHSARLGDFATAIFGCVFGSLSVVLYRAEHRVSP